MDSVRDKIIAMVLDACRTFRPDLSDTGRPLLTSGLDSLDYATVLMAVEDQFKISVADEDLEKLASIDDIVKFVEEHGTAA
jgi:acyl carrier protein